MQTLSCPRLALGRMAPCTKRELRQNILELITSVAPCALADQNVNTILPQLALVTLMSRRGLYVWEPYLDQIGVIDGYVNPSKRSVGSLVLGLAPRLFARIIFS